MINIEGLTKSFGQNKVLDQLDLNIAAGGIMAILGPNGSGKSTLIKLILGLCIPDRGKIEFSGESILKQYRYRKQIQYLPQIARFPENLKVYELINMLRDVRDSEADVQRLIEGFELEPFMNAKLKALSGGTRQKVNIVLTFMFDGKLMILDEPTTGLDPKALLLLKKLIQEEKSKGKTILITSHIMQFVEEVADELVYLLEGRIYFKGAIDELLQKTKTRDFEHAIAAIAS